MTSPDGGRVLVTNRRQARKVRVLTWVCAAVAIAVLYPAWRLWLTYGLSPGDGGVLRPPAQRAAWAVGVLILGLAPAVGMVGYARRYVTSIVQRADTVEITVLGVLRPRTYRLQRGDVRRTTSHDPQVRGTRAPWLTVRTTAGSFIVDLQADHVDEIAVQRLSR